MLGKVTNSKCRATMLQKTMEAKSGSFQALEAPKQADSLSTTPTLMPAQALQHSTLQGLRTNRLVQGLVATLAPTPSQAEILKTWSSS